MTTDQIKDALGEIVADLGREMELCFRPANTSFFLAMG